MQTTLKTHKVVRSSLILTLSTVLCVSLLSPSFGLFDKTRFVTDLGVAYFSYHHWVAKPFKEGGFNNGAPKRTSSIIKAGAALLFAANRVKAANKIAHESKDPLLHKLGSSLDNMTSSFTTIGEKFKSGKFNKEDVGTLGGSLDQVDSRARAAKLKVRDVQVAIPGA